MSESNNKEGVKVPWFFTGTILFAILLSLLFLNPDTSNSSTEVSEKESLSYSDTILIANDSIKDRLYAEYGLQVLKVNYDKYHNDWTFKLKNVSNRIIGDSKQLSLKLIYKVTDLKTDEVVKADYTFLNVNKLQVGETIQLHPNVSWSAYVGVKYRIDFWMENFPMCPYFLKLNY